MRCWECGVRKSTKAKKVAMPIARMTKVKKSEVLNTVRYNTIVCMVW